MDKRHGSLASQVVIVLVNECRLIRYSCVHQVASPNTMSSKNDTVLVQILSVSRESMKT